MKKKILAFVLLAALLLNALPVYAANAPTFRVDTVTAEAGETVEVTIWIDNNPGLASAKLVASFGSELTLTGVSFNAGLGGMSQPPQTLASPVILNWLNFMDNTNGDMYFAKLTFAVAEGAAAGTYPVTVSYDPEDVYNIDYDNIDFEVVNGGVVIEGEEEELPVAVTGVALDKATLSLTEGETAVLTATVSPADAANKEVTFVSENPAVATVDGTGKVTAVKAGTTTITVNTVDGGFTADCVVTVGCAHSSKTTTPAKDPDCTNKGWDAYQTCDGCGKLFNAEGEEISEIPFRPATGVHTGGTATCTKLAVCATCGAEYGTLGEHNYSAEVKSEETLSKAGTCSDEAVYFYSCSVCGEVEGDEAHTFLGEKDPDNHTGGTAWDGQREPDHANQIDGNTGTEFCLGCNKILTPGSVIPVDPHTAGSDLHKDSSGHWYVCSVEDCGAELQKAPHTPDHEGGATEEYAIKCVECGYVIEEQLDHIHDFKEIVDDQFLVSSADCENAAVYVVSCACGETGEATFEHGAPKGHKWQDATCEFPKTCEVCGETEGEALGHKPDRAEPTEKDAVKCTVCGEILTPALDHTHKIEHVAGSCYNTEYWFCEVCETYWADEDLIIITNSKNVIKAEASHNLEHVAESCYNTEYWHCDICQTYWADEDLIIITNSKNVIKAVPSHKAEHVAESCYNVEHWHCEACDTWFADEALTQITNSKNVIKAEASHNLEHVAESCYNTEYWHCDICQTYWADEKLAVITNVKNVIKAEPTHELVHVAESCYNTEHWFCEVCEIYWADEALTQITNAKNVIKAVPSHELEHYEAVASTCHDRGNVEYWRCVKCDSYYLDEACTQLTNAKSIWLGEKGSENLEHVARVEPTTETEGNVEYWYCPDCGRYFLDEACTQLTNAKNVIIPKISTPVTGDATNMIVLVALMAISAMGAAVIFTKKRRAA